MNFMPSAMRDIFLGPSQIKKCRERSLAQACGRESLAMTYFRKEGQAIVAAERMINACTRVAIAAVTGLAFYQLNISLAVAVVLSAVISVPALAIAAGASCLYLGVTALIAAVLTSTIQFIAIGLGFLAAGWVTLEIYDFYPIGLAEANIIQPLSKKYAFPLCDAIS